jgi:hypothetical protein
LSASLPRTSGRPTGGRPHWAMGEPRTRKQGIPPSHVPGRLYCPQSTMAYGNLSGPFWHAVPLAPLARLPAQLGAFRPPKDSGRQCGGGVRQANQLPTDHASGSRSAGACAACRSGGGGDQCRPTELRRRTGRLPARPGRHRLPDDAALRTLPLCEAARHAARASPGTGSARFLGSRLRRPVGIAPRRCRCRRSAPQSGPSVARIEPRRSPPPVCGQAGIATPRGQGAPRG